MWNKSPAEIAIRASSVAVVRKTTRTFPLLFPLWPLPVLCVRVGRDKVILLLFLLRFLLSFCLTLEV
jgi:hypothetical protein